MTEAPQTGAMTFTTRRELAHHIADDVIAYFDGLRAKSSVPAEQAERAMAAIRAATHAEADRMGDEYERDGYLVENSQEADRARIMEAAKASVRPA